MSLDKLAISYRCSNSIGNSLDLDTMSKEFLKTFILETEAINGTYFINDKNSLVKLISIGNKVSFDISSLVNSEKKEFYRQRFNEEYIILVFSVRNGFMAFLYGENTDFASIKKIFCSLKKRLNISINSCLNVQVLKKNNLLLFEQKEKLEDLTKNLRQKVQEATKENIEKEKKLFEQSKMSQMGELISNIAHQWRQPLSVMTTAASGMKLKKDMDLLSDEEMLSSIESILTNSKYLTNTLDEFSEYIKAGHKQKTVILQERLKIALRLVESSFTNEKIELIEGYIEKEELEIKIVVGELLRVLLSMFNNSKDAFLMNNIENRWIKYELFKKDNYALITIEDSAGGIPKSIIDKVFNPYFTTKHQYRGTGIGLYAGYDIIVNKMKGNLKVENSDNGAKFYIEIPLDS